MEKRMLINLQLKEGASPHLYIDQLKQMISENSTIHPQMKQTLKALKKLNQPFILLSQRKEIVFDIDNYRHFERSIEPKETPWVKTWWCEEERESCDKDFKIHVETILKSFVDLGYDIFDPEIVDEARIKHLEELTAKQTKPDGI